MKQIRTIYLWLAALITLAACTSTDDDSTTTLYNDAAITSFSLGTLKRTYDGTQSTYAGSSYQFKIDQTNRKIENTKQFGSTTEDAYWLPVGTDLSKVVCNITTKNNGSLHLKNVDDGEFTYYTATDSVDFSKDGTRTFRVYSSDGSGAYSDYVVKLNVHTVNGSTFVWELMPGMTPTPPTPSADYKQLLGSSTKERYAIGNDGSLLVSVDGGAWTTEPIAEDADKLPTQDIALVSYPLYLSDKTDYVLLAGTRVVSTTDAEGNTTETRLSTVWRKIVDYSGDTPEGQWVYMERESTDVKVLPALTGLSLVRFDGVVVAFGGDYKSVLASRDNGITWQPTVNLQMPTTDAATGTEFAYDGLTSITATTDSDNYIWLQCFGTNQVWRGRYNRMAWE